MQDNINTREIEMKEKSLGKIKSNGFPIRKISKSNHLLLLLLRMELNFKCLCICLLLEQVLKPNEQQNYQL